nr:Low density lipoprotein receptor class A cysteine rich [Hymenolepis microstoma]
MLELRTASTMKPDNITISPNEHIRNVFVTVFLGFLLAHTSFTIPSLVFLFFPTRSAAESSLRMENSSSISLLRRLRDGPRDEGILHAKQVNALECFQSPQNPIRFDSVVLSSESSRGSVKCYLDCTHSEYYLSVRITKLDLQGNCPTFTISEYSTLMIAETLESPNFPAISIYKPGDANKLAKATCNDSAGFVNKVIQTSTPGRKLMVEFDSGSVGKVNSFEITVTPYYLGTSYSCPADHFRCFNTKDHCIPDSITCDGVDNCFDNSDESNYLCTGRIGNLPLPLFIILVIVGVLFLLALITGVAIYLRRRHIRKQHNKPEVIDMNILRGQSAVQEPLMPPPPAPQQTI